MKVAKTHYDERAKDNFKKSKSEFQQKIVWKVKGMIKEHEKEQRIKFQPEKKEEKLIFFPPEKKSMFTFSSTEKKLTRDQKNGRNDITQVTA